MTSEEYLALTGKVPSDEDLTFVNCPLGGSTSHYFCGLCYHELPVRECKECYGVAFELTHRPSPQTVPRTTSLTTTKGRTT